MKIVHFSDPHAGGPAEDWLAYLDKRWVGVFNYTFRRRYRVDLELLRKAVAYILEARPDAAVCTGDLTSTGQPGEFAKIRPFLQPLAESGIPFFYLPGNHDCYVHRRRCTEAMKQAVGYYNQGKFQFDDLPVLREIGGLDFLAVNCSYPSNLLCSWGRLRKKDAEKLENWCREPKRRPRILISHYPLLERHPYLRLRHGLLGKRPAVQLLKEKKIDLSLCGHVHRPSLKVDDSGRGECCAGSVTMFGIMQEIEYHPERDVFTFREIRLD